METNENISEKLKIIGLNLENIPDKLYTFGSINFRIHKNYNEKNYKIYKYINVNDIEIFLTPTHRLTDYTEKYAKALPIGAYLSEDTEEDLERKIEFINLVRNLQIDELKEIEEQQNKLNKNIPYDVCFSNDYLWQIYYSIISKKYFMLVPIKENNCTTMFYVIKKQLENKKQKIFVPICYSEYSNKYLNNSQIEEIEKFLCFFTKEWPLIHEVYDKDNNMSLQIVGKTLIYDTIKTQYKIVLNEQGEAENFYKLLKALFILETQLAHYYKFNVKLDKKGQLHFYFNSDEIQYINLIAFIKKEYIQGLEKLIKSKEMKINLDKKLKTLKKIANNLDNDYFEKEKQISTFLECKKTFLGRIKYFIKYKKTKMNTTSKTEIEKDDNSKLKYCERTEIKDVYTIEELLILYETVEKERSIIKDYELDIEALNKKIDILKIKIKNANQYIKEIDKHKKSIFEFWKFTNKDEAKQLNEGIDKTSKNKKIKKTFNYELDFEEITKQFDKEQRGIFTKDETDNIFLITTEIIDDINSCINGKIITEEQFENVKEKMKKSEKIIDFDIFGSASSLKDEIQTLGNIKHRENKKNMFAILNLKEESTISEYINKIKDISISIQESLEKFKINIEIPIYKIGNLEDGLNVFYINPENALKYANNNEATLHKIILQENTNCIALTNIMYYNNTNHTLPLGMNVTDGILINTKKIHLEIKEKKQNYIIKSIIDETKPNALKLNITEYEIC